MRLSTRKVLDRSFSGLGITSIVLLGLALVVLLYPIISRGLGAFVFRGTIEFRKVMLEKFEHGDAEALATEVATVEAAQRPVFEMIEAFETQELKAMPFIKRREYRGALEELKDHLRELFGPLPGESRPVMTRDQYGQTRWDRAQEKLKLVLQIRRYDHSDTTTMGTEYYVSRAEDFKGTSLEKLFPYIEEHLEAMLAPRLTFYWRFLTDESRDAHFFGGIWAELLGTIYLTVGAMLFAVPMGVIAAIYLVEYAGDTWYINILRTCISTLAGVPSIVFGLFGLAFFINAVGVSDSKSVLAGAMTLALLVLPIIIRASEEAIRAVPRAYKEAALSLGASKWRTVVTVILPASLPGILTGIVISMGRAAGETAPIIFTAAVSVGRALTPLETLDQASLALPWNIYNLCTEHEAVDEIRHVQFGMVFVLVAVVLLLNATALILRARISKKLRG